MLDYGIGNLHSVHKALEHVGAVVTRVTEAPLPDGAQALVLPGVGHFGDGMREMEARGFTPRVREWIAADKPFLGICVGLQMLLEGSEEAPGVPGLGVCRGKVLRFRPSDPALKVPQMGWNRVAARSECPLFAGIPDDSYFYFVHSYYAMPDDAEVRAGMTTYDVRYCSFIWRGSMFASQFHPEKSQTVGLRLLRNFVALCADRKQRC
jgi:glutamine amidotransferase